MLQVINELMKLTDAEILRLARLNSLATFTRDEVVDYVSLLTKQSTPEPEKEPEPEPTVVKETKPIKKTKKSKKLV